MAIDPPSDIILDVMRAADPARRQMATEKLAQAGSSQAAGAQFAAVMEGAQPSNESFSCGVPEPAGVFYHGVPKAEPPEAYKKFEAFILQSFIQSMLPKSSEANYGSGTAGEVWRSLAAEEMGKTIAEAGGLGIADRLYSDSLGRASGERDDGAFSLASSLASESPLKDWASNLPYVEGAPSEPDDT
jgi:peptidoglycan hydrolase FlgJ